MLISAYQFGMTLLTIFMLYRYFITNDKSLLYIGLACLNWDAFYIIIQIIVIYHGSELTHQVGFGFIFISSILEIE